MSYKIAILILFMFANLLYAEDSQDVNNQVDNSQTARSQTANSQIKRRDKIAFVDIPTTNKQIENLNKKIKKAEDATTNCETKITNAKNQNKTNDDNVIKITDLIVKMNTEGIALFIYARDMNDAEAQKKAFQAYEENEDIIRALIKKKSDLEYQMRANDRHIFIQQSIIWTQKKHIAKMKKRIERKNLEINKTNAYINNRKNNINNSSSLISEAKNLLK